MKIKIMMKSPDAVHHAIREVAELTVPEDKHEFAYERDSEIDEAAREIAEKLKRWIVHDEYLTVEFDLDAGTAVVCEQG